MTQAVSTLQAQVADTQIQGNVTLAQIAAQEAVDIASLPYENKTTTVAPPVTDTQGATLAANIKSVETEVAGWGGQGVSSYSLDAVLKQLEQGLN